MGARWSRAICAAVIAFDIAFVWPSITPTRVLWYEPLMRRWELSVRPEILAMDWYGKTGLALVVGALVLAGTFWLAPREPRPRTLSLFIGWACMATGLALGLQVFQLMGRHPVPEPLPAGYEKR